MKLQPPSIVTVLKLLCAALALASISLVGPGRAGAQELRPDKTQIYENETITIDLNLKDVPNFKQLAAASFTVSAPVNFGIEIEPGNLFDPLSRDTVDGYIFQVRPNTPALGAYTVSIALAGDPLPQLNANGTSLAKLTLAAPAATDQVEAEVTVTDLKGFDRNGQPLFSQTTEIAAPLIVQPIDGVTVLGQVSQEQGIGNFVPAQGADVQLYSGSTMTPILGTETQTDPQGAFEVGGGIGDVRLHTPPLSGQRPLPDGYLPAAANLVLSGGPPTPLDGVRRLAGDVVAAGEDDHCPAINMADIVALAQRVGGPPASGGNIFDLNRDSVIDAADLVLAAINYNNRGYINWQSGQADASFCTAGG